MHEGESRPSVSRIKVEKDRENYRFTPSVCMYCTVPKCQSCNVNCRIGRIFFDIPRRLDGKGIIKAYQVFYIGGVWTSGQEQGDYEGGGFRVPPITGWEPDEGGVELHILCDDLGIDLWVLLVFQPWLVRCQVYRTRRGRA